MIVSSVPQVGLDGRMGGFARPLLAEIHQDSRRAERRTLSLSTQVSSYEDSTKALIHDLSENGLMIETSAELKPGDSLFVDLPFVGTIEARIVWQKDSSYGCEFLEPVSQATVSAAMLRSTPENPQSRPETVIEELKVGVRPTLEEMTSWEVEFERTKGAAGYQLIGFRQTQDGMIIAMVTKTN